MLIGRDTFYEINLVFIVLSSSLSLSSLSLSLSSWDSFCLKRKNQNRPHPNAVENVAIREDSDVEVGLNDVMEPALLLVPEEGVGHPNLGRAVRM